MLTGHQADLYGLPIEEFTTARNELADRLKAAGDKGEAKRVRALKKPSLPAWALNQLARRDPDGLERLFGLRDSIEAASSAAELRSRTEERRKLLTKLVAESRAILESGGHSPAANTIEKISQTLLAAGDDERDEVLAGTLTRELTSSSTTFGAFGSFDAATVTFEDEPDEPDPRIERLKQEAQAAEDRARELESIAKDAEEKATSARDEADEAKRHAKVAREKADRAEKN